MSEDQGLDTRTVYVRLLDEGTDAWRPTAAVELGKNEFLLLGPVPSGEFWEFPPGSSVCVEWKTLSGIRSLVAVRLK